MLIKRLNQELSNYTNFQRVTLKQSHSDISSKNGGYCEFIKSSTSSQNNKMYPSLILISMVDFL